MLLAFKCGCANCPELIPQNMGHYCYICLDTFLTMPVKFEGSCKTHAKAGVWTLDKSGQAKHRGSLDQLGQLLGSMPLLGSPVNEE